MKFSLAVALPLAVGARVFAQSPAPVAIESDLSQGVVANALTVAKDVTFAAPPVGELRWRVSQSITKWEGVRAAEKFSPGDGKGLVSENCLYLNLRNSTTSAGGKVSVLGWIYGGSFSCGFNSTPRDEYLVFNSGALCTPFL